MNMNMMGFRRKIFLKPHNLKVHLLGLKVKHLKCRTLEHNLSMFSTMGNVLESTVDTLKMHTQTESLNPMSMAENLFAPQPIKKHLS